MLNDLEYLFGQLPTGADDETVGTLVPVEGQPGLLEVTAGFFSYSQSSRKNGQENMFHQTSYFWEGFFFPAEDQLGTEAQTPCRGFFLQNYISRIS